MEIVNIRGYETFEKIEPISKGRTNDKKYYIVTMDKKELLLRISDASEYECKKFEFNMLKQLSELDIPIPRPIDFGLCDNNSVYQLLTWVEGKDVQSILPVFTETEQYNIGLKAGKLLKTIHSIPAPEGTEDWSIKFNRMLTEQLDEYNSRLKLYSKLYEVITGYFYQNKHLTGNRPQTFNHGDFHPENIIVMPDGEVGVIDFSCGYGDPCYDISRAGWYPEKHPYFYSGLIYGHYNGEPDIIYWKAYTHCWALYTLYALTCPKWVGLGDMENGMNVVWGILNWSDNLLNPIPKWYIKNPNMEAI